MQHLQLPSLLRKLAATLAIGSVLFSTQANAEYCKPIKIEQGCDPFALDYFVTDQATGSISPLQVWYTEQGTFYRKANGVLVSWQPQGKNLYFRRWMETEQLVIEYEPSDLSSLGHQKVEWKQVRGLLASELLNQMHFVKDSEWNRYDTTLLASKEHAQEVELLDRYQVPTQVIVQGRPTMVLSRLYDTEQVEQWLNNLKSFDRMDFADIGDHENDTRVAKLIHQGFVPGHSSSTHSH
ncbi:hypothetical protein ACFOEK_15890 [Litoribrevibacter euphylliae]|uniref:Uncharacterized protein n=1 Tax=Litoribrevibacter euphylliae TaxID=1834034 RepID=A0ABV7HMD1_9GAMM